VRAACYFGSFLIIKCNLKIDVNKDKMMQVNEKETTDWSLIAS
jgi:hypothetical protein